jgi:ABC-2 type transport system ATP-binding protein
MDNQLLEINQLSYQRNLKTILKNLSLNTQSGQIVGLLGANGAGKTTLMRLIAGSYINRHGSITIKNSESLIERKASVSFTEQISGMNSRKRLYQIAEFYARVYPDFSMADFTQLLTELKLGMDQRLNQLSKGNRRKFIIAITLARQTDLYLLDEPFDGIDSMSRKRIIASIIQWKPDNATILVSDHHVGDIANLLDQVVVVKNRCVVAQESADTIRETLGKDIETYYEDFYKEERIYD